MQGFYKRISHGLTLNISRQISLHDKTLPYMITCNFMTKYYVDNGECAYVGTVNHLKLCNSFNIVSVFESKMVLLCVTY